MLRALDDDKVALAMLGLSKHLTFRGFEGMEHAAARIFETISGDVFRTAY